MSFGPFLRLLVRQAGVYSNFLAVEGEARVREAYPPPTYDRLAEIKRRYDPSNLFLMNQNIRPAASVAEAARRAGSLWNLRIPSRCTDPAPRDDSLAGGRFIPARTMRPMTKRSPSSSRSWSLRMLPGSFAA